MARGTFANTRIINKLSSEVGPKTLFHEELTTIFDAAERY